MSVEPLPDWLHPDGGITALDLDDMPGLPPHTELIDGGLFFTSPQRRFHSDMKFLLQAGLRRSVPENLRVVAEMSIILDEQQRPEPDVAVIDASVRRDLDETWYPGSAVRLAVEVVSPESKIRDRERKPQLYARAGIPYFWRVEENDGRPVVYVYEIDPSSGTYVPSGIYHEQLKLTVPFDIEIDLGDVD